MKLITPHQFRDLLHLEDSIGVPPALAPVADLLRWSVWRSGTCLRSDARSDVYDFLIEAGYDPADSTGQIQSALDRLITLGDIAIVNLAGLERLAAIPPRIVALGDSDLAALVGTLPSRLFVGAQLLDSQVVTRRFSRADIATVTRLIELGAEEWSLRAWIGIPESASLLRRHGVDDHTPPVKSWAALKAVFVNDGGTDPDIDTARSLIEITAGSPGHIDLQDSDEFRWLLFLKSISDEAECEYSVSASFDSCSIRFTTEPPRQVVRILDLFGDRSHQLQWHVQDSLHESIKSELRRLGIP